MRAGVGLAVVLAACSGSMMMTGNEPDAGDDGGPDARRGDGGTVDGSGSAAPTAAELLGALGSCSVVGGDFATDEGGTQDIPICGLSIGVYFQADMDVDCDGKMSAQCNSSTDPDYQDQTAAVDSNGDPLDAAALPYVVIPGVSGRFDYESAGLHMGSVVAVVYQGELEYGVLGDVGPTSAIGEASYAMAEALGIDPDPATGGVDSGVTYVAFTGSAGIVDPIEDPAQAVAVGIARARALIGH